MQHASRLLETDPVLAAEQALHVGAQVREQPLPEVPAHEPLEGDHSVGGRGEVAVRVEARDVGQAVERQAQRRADHRQLREARDELVPAANAGPDAGLVRSDDRGPVDLDHLGAERVRERGGGAQVAVSHVDGDDDRPGAAMRALHHPRERTAAAAARGIGVAPARTPTRRRKGARSGRDERMTRLP